MNKRLLSTSSTSLRGNSFRTVAASSLHHSHNNCKNTPGKFIVVAVFIQICFALWTVPCPTRLPFDICPTATTNAKTTEHKCSQLELLDANLPIFPSLKTDNVAAITAMDDLLRRYSNKSAGGWIHINPLAYTEVDVFRNLGKTIMARNTTCGKPRILGELIARGLRYCFWANDLVSSAAMQHFNFEEPLWTWVWTEFLDLETYTQTMLESDYKNNGNSKSNGNGNSNKRKPVSPWNATHGNCHLGFLDIGVNVGDWASPLRTAFPLTTPYFGIEGTPGTGAIAIANMRTSMEHHTRNNRTVVGPTALLPFSLLSKAMVPRVRESGGVCFSHVPTNVGGQGIDSVRTMEQCKPSSAAGGTLLSHALRSLVPLQQSSCPGRIDWPRIYIAKIDIEGFEFKAMLSAMDWFLERPPCYLMLECQKFPQTTAVLELLLDIGYDSMWRAHHTHQRNADFPLGPPLWTSLQNKTLHNIVQADLAGAGLYKDYVFGFADKETCLRRLLE